MKIVNIARHIIFIALATVAICAQAQPRDKVLNRPYADLKRLHLGFSVGVAMQNLSLTNNGYVSPEGNAWVADVPNLSPGFTVGVLADLRICNHLNLRFSPGMQFGSKTVKFRDINNPESPMSTQNVKSTFVVMPIDLKVSADRYHNVRPYLVGGVTGVLDVSKRRKDQLQFNATDAMLTIGFGCDIYLQYFKLCPEIKFCFGLSNILKRDRPDLEDDTAMQAFTQSINKAKNNMMIITFYFE